MQSVKLLFKLFYRPASAMSEIIDRGSWFLAAAFVLIVSAAFFFTVNTKLQASYAAPDFEEFYKNDKNLSSPENEARYNAAIVEYKNAVAVKQQLPLVGDTFFRFFNFETGGFAKFFFALAVFYAPLVILLVSLFTSNGKFGDLLTREYGALSTCAMMAWAASHIPFALAGVWFYGQNAPPEWFFALWLASGVLFGVLMVFAVRVVFGANYLASIAVSALTACGIVLAMNVFQLVSPWMLAPIVLFYIYTHFSGKTGSEISGWATAFREKQNSKLALERAAANPYDAAPHVQLGLIYRQRKQSSKSLEHFKKAFEIDRNEIEVNYELGKIARVKGNLQTALDHFGAVVEQNERYSLNEIWREIGATYWQAGMLAEAREALEKFAVRRPFDAEGLYYLGKVLKAQSEHRMARDIFSQAIESVKTSPIYRRREVRYWSKLAEKEI